jgi:hypothetical protein
MKNGKGDKDRVKSLTKYRQNYDKINWSNKTKPININKQYSNKDFELGA